MITVDKIQFAAWCEGTLLDFRNGKGIVVNEQECNIADKALQHGETVLLRVGSKLTGTEIVFLNGAYHERKLHTIGEEQTEKATNKLEDKE